MHIEFTVKDRLRFFKGIDSSVESDAKAFLFKKINSPEGLFRIILLPTNGEGVRVVVEKKVGENLIGEPIFKLWDDISCFERLKADTWLIKTLFSLLSGVSEELDENL